MVLARDGEGLRLAFSESTSCLLVKVWARLKVIKGITTMRVIIKTILGFLIKSKLMD